MAIAMIIPEFDFPIHVPLFDVPNSANNRFFGVFGNTLADTLINYAGQGASVAVGELGIEAEGIRQYGNANYLRFSQLGALSSAGVTIMVAFRAPVANLAAGLINLWSQTSKNSDTARTRIFLDSPSAGVLRVSATPTPTGADDSRRIALDSPHIVSISRNGNGVAGYLRFHDANGAVLAEIALPALSTGLTYASDVALEIGNASSTTGGGCLIHSAALWTGVMSPAAIVEAAALMAEASGVFGD